MLCSYSSFAVRAFHLKWRELPLDTNIRKWDVVVLELDRHKRHLDRATLQDFWNILDKCAALAHMSSSFEFGSFYMHNKMVISYSLGLFGFILGGWRRIDHIFDFNHLSGSLAILITFTCFLYFY